jgi:hypothetical protein
MKACSRELSLAAGVAGFCAVAGMPAIRLAEMAAEARRAAAAAEVLRDIT